MIEFFNPFIDIALISIVVSVFYQVLQGKFVNQDKMKESQKKMKEHQDRIKELSKRTDEHAQKEMEKTQAEMLEVTQEMMQGSMKMMLVSMIVIIPLWGFLGANYEGITINLPMPVPFWHNAELLNPVTWFSFKFYESTSWIGWYVLISLITSLGLNLAKGLLKEAKKFGILGGVQNA